MKTLSVISLSLLVTVSCALASGGTEVEGPGLMTSFFIAFGALIVLYQLIPGLRLIGGLLKELFTSIDEKSKDANCK